MEDNYDEISLVEIIEILIKQKYIILGITLICFIFGVLASYLFIGETIYTNIQFNHKQLDEGLNPDGTSFNINDQFSIQECTLDIFVNEDSAALLFNAESENAKIQTIRNLNLDSNKTYILTINTKEDEEAILKAGITGGVLSTSALEKKDNNKYILEFKTSEEITNKNNKLYITSDKEIMLENITLLEVE